MSASDRQDVCLFFSGGGHKLVFDGLREHIDRSQFWPLKGPKLGLIEVASQEIIDSNIQGPAIIGSGVRIERSNIGPYVSVGDGCKIDNSTVERSVLMEGSFVSGVMKLTKSVLGREVEINGEKSDQQKPTSIMLGDKTKMDLSNG